MFEFIKKIMMTLSFLSLNVASVWAADEDDFYIEAHANTAINQKGRWLMGTRVGYVFRDDLGLGVVYEEHFSRNFATQDSSFNRMGLEFRWFQEPFEFSAALGLAQRMYRDQSKDMQIVPSVSAVYLWAITHSMAIVCDFTFYFLDDPRVIFSGGLGGRILF